MATRAACQLALRPMSHLGRRMPSYRRNKAVRVAASLSGTWEKDSAASGSMDETADVFELNFAVKQAVKLLKFMDIEDTETYFKTSINAVLYSIDETYPKSGAGVRHKRRDLRSGELVGRFEVSEDGCPSIIAEWGDPVKGSCTDVFQLDGDTLTQVTSYRRSSTGQATHFSTVHRRVKSGDDGW